MQPSGPVSPSKEDEAEADAEVQSPEVAVIKTTAKEKDSMATANSDDEDEEDEKEAVMQVEQVKEAAGVVNKAEMDFEAAVAAAEAAAKADKEQ